MLSPPRPPYWWNKVALSNAFMPKLSLYHWPYFGGYLILRGNDNGDMKPDLMADLATKQQLIRPVEELALMAGQRILEIRTAGPRQQIKPDGSPVTDADLAADAIISKGLYPLNQDWPVITEEDWDESRDHITSDYYWCVDPLDGTKGFLNGGKDFTVNIALIYDRYPVLGVIFAPARKSLWATDGDHVWRREVSRNASRLSDMPPIPIQTRPCPVDRPTVITTMAKYSQTLTHWLDDLTPSETISVGSSLKFCYLAEGKADFYPRIGTTMEWDTAAGQAILEAAGGKMIDHNGNRFSYGKPGRMNARFAAMGNIGDDASIPENWYPPTPEQRPYGDQGS